MFNFTAKEEEGQKEKNEIWKEKKVAKFNILLEIFKNLSLKNEGGWGLGGQGPFAVAPNFIQVGHWGLLLDPIWLLNIITGIWSSSWNAHAHHQEKVHAVVGLRHGVLQHDLN